MAEVSENMNGSGKPESVDFIREIINEDIKNGKHEGRVHTRFPPEPNGYLHLGHAKSICLNFGIADEYKGQCNLRFDDTNPTKEEVEYVESIQEDVKWLGFDWEDRLFFASDYFDVLYDYAEKLILMGKAFVCDLNADQMREYRGTLTEPGKESPYRNRSIEENLDLFRRMKAGEFPEGSRTLRARIDMASPNINMRDPVIYRIMFAHHHRTGDKWCIYPMYDYAHCISDAQEGITHSICTLEFEDHRPLYDWFLDVLETPHHPQQIEFAKLNVAYTIFSKRRLNELVKRGITSGWDDPAMPSLAGIRRRGYTPEAIRKFATIVGVAKRDTLSDMALLEYCIREDLNKKAQRAMAVLKPLKLIITNYPDGESEELEAVNNPEDPAMGTRKVPFGRELYIERDDFMENPVKGYFRLFPGNEVRLRWAYFVKCNDFRKDPLTGEVTEIYCTYDPESKGGNSPDGRKVKSTIHWVNAGKCISAEVRLYDRLFTVPDPADAEEGKTWIDYINPHVLDIVKDAKLEPFMAGAVPGINYQFERLGYFVADSKDSAPGSPVFNRTVTLKDSWAKLAAK
ncbi:MAG: glutamine--tRNA ligase/YqeY domain fusion protein [Ignavibacteriaceae bacterium]|nr:glutamine--tRNA ligase/YqeY domain fusion protein [Ignavibacteriaceae bacterium]